MPNESYRARVIRQAKDAVEAAKEATKQDHMGQRGLVREVAARRLLEPFLTSDYATGKGFIVDSHDFRSAQTDLIIWCPSILPPVLVDPSKSENDGDFPVEACLYSIEVKSLLTAVEVKDAVAKAMKLRTLNMITFSHLKHNMAFIHPSRRVAFSLFAFGTDLTPGGKTDLARYAEYDPNWRSDPVIPAICIVGRGYWLFINPGSGWRYFPANENFDEVVGFITGLTNTLPIIRASRYSPPFGHYLSFKPYSEAVPNSGLPPEEVE